MNTKELPLADQLQDTFRKGAHTKGYNLAVLELDHALVIQGKVKTFFAKQMAQEEAGRFLKVKQQQGLGLMLRNEIVVG